MREILFRGKLIDGDAWVNGDLIHNGDDCFPITLIGGIVVSHDEHTSGISFDGHWLAEVVPETVGQYTGLKDRNGKRIFEGDIVAGTKYGKPCTGVIAYGKWNCGCCWGVYGFATVHGPEIRDSEQNLEVIGNIYDNPELVPEMEEDDE